MPFNPFMLTPQNNGIFGQGQMPKAPASPYDIGQAGQYGLSPFDPEATRKKQRLLGQKQVDDSMSGAMERGIAGGSFNPDVSGYGATQSARNSMYGADVGLDQYAHDDQYKLMNSLLGIDSNKLNRENLDFQKYQYEDSKPSWLSTVADLGMGVAGAFLEEGGTVGEINTMSHPIHDKRKWYMEEGGIVPSDDPNKKLANAPLSNTWSYGSKEAPNLINNSLRQFAPIIPDSNTIFKELPNGITFPFPPEGGLGNGANELLVGSDTGQPRFIKSPQDLLLGTGTHFEGGGTIPDSNYFHNSYGGYIPSSEANSPPTVNQPTNDNTLIKAKTGESIMNEHATSLFGEDTVKAINEASKIAGNFFAGGGVIPKPMGGQAGNTIGAVTPTPAMGGGAMSAMPVNSMGTGGGNMDWYNPKGSMGMNMGGLMGNAFKKIGGLFADGGTVGGDEQSPFTQQLADLYHQYQLNKANPNVDPDVLRKITEAIVGVEQQQRDWQATQHSKNLGVQGATPLLNAPPNQQPLSPPPQTPQGTDGGGGTNQGTGGGQGQFEHTITIKRKPLAQALSDNPPQEQDGVYAGSGYTMPMR